MLVEFFWFSFSVAFHFLYLYYQILGSVCSETLVKSLLLPLLIITALAVLLKREKFIKK